MACDEGVGGALDLKMSRHDVVNELLI